jgi:hypothetical protein
MNNKRVLSPLHSSAALEEPFISTKDTPNAIVSQGFWGYDLKNVYEKQNTYNCPLIFTRDWFLDPFGYQNS